MKIIKVLTFTILFALFSALIIKAEVPSLLSYQGYLTDSYGNPIANGTYEIGFGIYDAPEQGHQLWSETYPSLTVANGLVAVLLGSITPLNDSAFSSSERFLEITVAGEVIIPRTRFTTVGFSFRTSTIDGSSGGEISGLVTISPDGTGENSGGLIISDGNGATRIKMDIADDSTSSIGIYEPVDTKAFGQTIKKMEINNDGLIMFGKGDDTSVIMTQDETGSGSIAIYEPTDSKNTFSSNSKKLILKQDGMILFGNNVGDTSIVMTQDETSAGTIQFYEPTDSKNPFSTITKRIEMNNLGLVMFGATEFDTSLYVAPNGDIIGLGQITMGLNSSAGFETSVLGFNNNANADSSTIGGGSANATNGSNSVISGGHQNTTYGSGSSISGGSFNTANGDFSTIGGGHDNSADGENATVPGGSLNSANGMNSMAAGYRAKAEHDGSFVWADKTEADFVTTNNNQFIIRASGGVGIGTNNPSGLLEIRGEGGDSVVILPNNAVGSDELANETGLSSDRQNFTVILEQDASAMTDLATTTITTPTDGYILVRGGSNFKASGTPSANQVFVQIDQTSGGFPIPPYFTVAGRLEQDFDKNAGSDTTSLDGYNKTNSFSINCERVYMLPAGEHTFILEGITNSQNSRHAISAMINSYITAMFISTAYGTVEQ